MVSTNLYVLQRISKQITMGGLCTMISEASKEDWNDFWYDSSESGTRPLEYAPDNEYIDNVLIKALINEY